MKRYVAPAVPVSACRFICKICKLETHSHCSSLKNEMKCIHLILSPASYLSRFMPRKTNSPTWSQWLLKMLDLKTQKWSSNQGLYQFQSLGSRVKVKERKNQCQRKQGYRGESTVGRWFDFKWPKEQKWRMQLTLVGIV